VSRIATLLQHVLKNELYYDDGPVDSTLEHLTETWRNDAAEGLGDLEPVVQRALAEAAERLAQLPADKIRRLIRGPAPAFAKAVAERRSRNQPLML
jgi:hypothetical protein